MPTELEELVDFINHGNTQVRQTAVENLVSYSQSDPSVFKANQLVPVKNLKLLVRDYKQIAKDALNILINLSMDGEVLEYLASDTDFLETLLARVTNPKEPNATLHTMLLANLSKSPSILTLVNFKRLPLLNPPNTDLAISQLLDLFVRGASSSYNPSCNFEYLSYLFADLASYPQGRLYFLSRQDYDGILPLTKLIVFTDHQSDIRRKGIASTIKNCCFETPSHALILSANEINILPYILLPLMGNEEYGEDETDTMLEDLQLLPPDKQREVDTDILKTYLETLMLLTTTKEGRNTLRETGVYYVIRETHLAVEDDGVRELCERLVQVLMRDEEGEKSSQGSNTNGMKALDKNGLKAVKQVQKLGGRGGWVQAEDVGSDDDKILEV